MWRAWPRPSSGWAAFSIRRRGSGGRRCFWTPNGSHRLAALRRLGARAVVALVVPEPEVAHRILAAQYREGAQPARARARGRASGRSAGRAMTGRSGTTRSSSRSRRCSRSGSATSRTGASPAAPITPCSSAPRSSLEQAVPRARSASGPGRAAARARCRRWGGREATPGPRVSSPYLRAFVVARINPLRFKRGAKADPDEILAKMLAAARRFDADRVRPDQVAQAGGPPEESSS